MGYPRQVERSRFTDGGWHVDVFLGDKVTYTDAATIVRAIRRTELTVGRSEITVVRNNGCGRRG
jgi:hypothetical protein